MSLTAFLLIVSLGTGDTAVTVIVKYPTLAKCELAGETSLSQFEVIKLRNADGVLVSLKPEIDYTCFEAPVQ
jgi:hypothetical protein